MIPVRDTRNSARFGPGFTFLGKGAWSESDYWNPQPNEYVRWGDIVALARAKKGVWLDRMEGFELRRDCFIPMDELAKLRRLREDDLRTSLKEG